MCLRDLTVLVRQACGTLAVVDDAQVRARDRRAAWSESFNEMFAQVAGVFGNPATSARPGVPTGAAVARGAEEFLVAGGAGGGRVAGRMQRLLNFSP